MQLFLFQRNWKKSQLLVLVLSVAAWVVIAFLANLLLFVDFNFYHVSSDVIPCHSLTIVLT